MAKDNFRIKKRRRQKPRDFTVASKPSPNTKNEVRIVSQASSSHTPEDFILSDASQIASQPLRYSDPDVWGVLTAISSNARKRHQGINMLLTSDEHCIGRLVDDTRFQIISNAVSGNHCKIYRKRVAVEDLESSSNLYKSVFLKDTSTNGTYLNWEKLTKNSSEAELHHGDIISFACPPQHEFSIAFVFREVLKSTSSTNGAILKRKAEEFGSKSKRVKGMGIGAPEGPILLDDFRSLQRSNKEIKDLKESVSKSYIDQFKELHDSLEVKQKELLEINRITTEQRHAMEDLNERLSASMQSCTKANEVINSQKASISELKAQLDKEREQRREERENAAVDLRASIEKVQAEAALRREREQQKESEKERCSLVETLRSNLGETRQKLFISDNKVRQLESQVREEQVASVNGRKKVEELEHEMKTLRKELESEKAAREEAWAKVSALDVEINAAMQERIMLRERQLRAFYSTTEEIPVLSAKQHEQLKAMQRTLEDEENHESTSVVIDLNQDYGNFNGTLARENEASGHRNNSIAKGGSATFVHRCGRNQAKASSNEASVTDKHVCDIRNHEEDRSTQEAEFSSMDHPFVKGGFGSDIVGVGTEPVLDGDAIGTERILETESLRVCGDRNFDLNCSPVAGDTMQLDEETHVQEVKKWVWTSLNEILHHSQSNNPLDIQNSMEDIEAGGTIRTADLLASEVAGSWACSTAPSVHGENGSAGRDNEEDAAAAHDSNVWAAESPGVCGDRNFDLNCSPLAGDTMQLDDKTHVQEVEERVWRTLKEILHHSQSNNPLHIQNTMEDAEAGGTIKAADLLASKVAGSWACSTAHSVHGENESAGRDNEDNAAAAHDSKSNVKAAEGQSTPCSEVAAAIRRNQDRRARLGLSS